MAAWLALATALGCSSPPPETSPASPPIDPFDRQGNGPDPSAEKQLKLPAEKMTVVSERERLEALGVVTGLEPLSRLAFSPSDFQPLPAPLAGEWLAEHPERAQSYPDFVKAKRLRPDDERHTLYIQPLGGLEESGAPALTELAHFAKLYFNLKTAILPAIDPELASLKWRSRASGRQINTDSVLDLLRERLPSDAFLLIAVTGHDLYPADDWSFVFGIATFRERVGVYSTARYNPEFGVGPPPTSAKTLILRRTLNVMAHEIGHMFGLTHCVHYRCAMNGSNSLLETDRSPIHMCPVCLRKLRHGAGFDIAERYQGLERFYRTRGLLEEAAWIKARLRRFARELAAPPEVP